jgi:hypothetical protein
MHLERLYIQLVVRYLDLRDARKTAHEGSLRKRKSKRKAALSSEQQGSFIDHICKHEHMPCFNTYCDIGMVRMKSAPVAARIRPIKWLNNFLDFLCMLPTV